ncbi:MAG: hypothetical protein ABF321_10140 [Bacteroidia bacterium]
MKKFVTSVIAFSLVLVAYFGVNIMVNSHLNSKQVKVGDSKIIAVGDSHIMTAVDPQFSMDLINIAQSSEPYLASYLKIKKILESQSEVETVVLGLGYHNLSGYYDQKLLTNESTAIFDNNIQLLGTYELSNQSYDFERYVNSFLKNQCIYPQLKKRYLGAYKATRSDLAKADLSQTVKKHFYEEEQIHDFSDTFNLFYLGQIVNLCSDYNINLVLAKTPTTKKYMSQVPIVYRGKLQAVVANFKKKGVYTFALEIEDKEVYFKDHSHLSAQGAQVFTPKLLDYIARLK